MGSLKRFKEATAKTSADPRTKYTQTRKALTARLNQASPLDSDNKLAAAMEKAENYFLAELFDEALESLDVAGQMATALISASKTYQKKDGEPKAPKSK